MANKLSQILEVFAPHHLYNTDLEDTRLSKPHSLKLNFRGIKEIDELPAFQLETYSQIQELSLNHNKLKSLKGLQQFKNLQKLSVNNNSINNLEDQLKEYISKPRILTELWCQNNLQEQTTIKSQHFKSAIKSIFPNLISLNGESVKNLQATSISGIRPAAQRSESSEGSSSSCFSSGWIKREPLAVERQGKSAFSPVRAVRPSHDNRQSVTSSPSGADSKNKSSKYRRQIFGIQNQQQEGQDPRSRHDGKEGSGTMDMSFVSGLLSNEALSPSKPSPERDLEYQRHSVKITHSPLRMGSRERHDRGILSQERSILHRIDEDTGEVTEFTATLASNHQQNTSMQRNEIRRNNNDQQMTFNAENMESKFGKALVQKEHHRQMFSQDLKPSYQNQIEIEMVQSDLRYEKGGQNQILSQQQDFSNENPDTVRQSQNSIKPYFRKSSRTRSPGRSPSHPSDLFSNQDDNYSLPQIEAQIPTNSSKNNFHQPLSFGMLNINQKSSSSGGEMLLLNNNKPQTLNHIFTQDSSIQGELISSERDARAKYSQLQGQIDTNAFIQVEENIMDQQSSASQVISEEKRQMGETQQARIQYQQYLEEKQALQEKLQQMQEQYNHLQKRSKSANSHSPDNSALNMMVSEDNYQLNHISGISDNNEGMGRNWYSYQSSQERRINSPKSQNGRNSSKKGKIFRSGSSNKRSSRSSKRKQNPQKQNKSVLKQDKISIMNQETKLSQMNADIEENENRKRLQSDASNGYSPNGKELSQQLEIEWNREQQLQQQQQYIDQQKYDLPFSAAPNSIHQGKLRENNQEVVESKRQHYIDHPALTSQVSSPQIQVVSSPGSSVMNMFDKLNTLEQIARNGATQTLEPYERVEMFISRRQLTFLLQIFYQWRSIAKMRLNTSYPMSSEYSKSPVKDTRSSRGSSKSRSISRGQIPKNHSGILRNGELYKNQRSSYDTNLAKSILENKRGDDYFTFAQNQHRNIPLIKKKLTVLMNKKLDKEYLFDLRYCYTQWIRCSLYMKMKQLEMLRDQSRSSYKLEENMPRQTSNSAMQIVQGPTPLDQSRLTNQSQTHFIDRGGEVSNMITQKNKFLSASHENLLQENQSVSIMDNIEKMKFRYDGYISEDKYNAQKNQWRASSYQREDIKTDTECPPGLTMSKLNSRPPLPIAQKKVMFKLEADDKNRLLSAESSPLKSRSQYLSSDSSIYEPVSRMHISGYASEKNSNQVSQLKRSSSTQKQKPLKKKRDYGDREIKNLLIHKNQGLLKKILREWQMYSLKNFRKRMIQRQKKKVESKSSKKKDKVKQSESKVQKNLKHNSSRVGSKSMIMSGVSSSKGLRTQKTIIVPSNPEKSIQKARNQRQSGANTPSITHEKIELGQFRNRSRVVENDASYENRPINIHIKHKQFHREIVDSPEITPKQIEPNYWIRIRKPVTKMLVTARPSSSTKGIKMGSQNFTSTHVLKSSGKNWKLPHNKFNYPHVPVQVVKSQSYTGALLKTERKRSKSASTKNSCLRQAYTSMGSVPMLQRQVNKTLCGNI